MNPHSADPTLLLLLDEVRRKTLTRLEGLTETQARFAPEGLQNSILWHAGHCYIVVEWLTMEALGGATTSPPTWFELFSWASRPGENPNVAWPTLDEVIQELQLQHGRMHKLLQNLTAEDFDNPARNRPDITVRHRILHALHDEACHSGEIWLLRKLQGV
ncbi:MAG: DinB family protein [Planctomycetaceae bacterium]|nr:DinB family protein [Planctomycetaceae bacterium]